MLERMTIRSALQRSGGIARTSTLTRAGINRPQLRAAFEAGEVVRPRKGWVALPEADPALLQAARRGALLSCATQAARLGLWVFAEPDEPHYAAPHRHSHVARGPGIVHWRSPVVPRAPELLGDPLENVLVLVAVCQPQETALAIIDSALNTGLTTVPALEQLAVPSLSALLRQASPFTDSGLESFFRSRLAWLRIPIHAQTHLHGHRVDFLIGERLVVQIDGKQHSRAQRDADIRHDALLRREGYTVIRVTYSLVVFHWPEVQDMILSAVARGHHLRGTGPPGRSSGLQPSRRIRAVPAALTVRADGTP
jgi:very-short-patch-repair endonuclease